MTAVDELLARHHHFQAGSGCSEVLQVSSPRPRLGLTIITCMDARIDIFKVLGLRCGEAHLLRNGGGLVTDDVLRSLVVSQRALGTREVMVVMHTDCGLSGLRDADLAEEIRADTAIEPPAFGGFDDVEAEVLRSVERVRLCPWLSWRDGVRGFVYDVATACLHELTSSATPGSPPAAAEELDTTPRP